MLTKYIYQHILTKTIPVCKSINAVCIPVNRRASAALGYRLQSVSGKYTGLKAEERYARGSISQS